MKWRKKYKKSGGSSIRSRRSRLQQIEKVLKEVEERVDKEVVPIVWQKNITYLSRLFEELGSWKIVAQIMTVYNLQNFWSPFLYFPKDVLQLPIAFEILPNLHLSTKQDLNDS